MAKGKSNNLHRVELWLKKSTLSHINKHLRLENESRKEAMQRIIETQVTTSKAHRKGLPF